MVSDVEARHDDHASEQTPLLAEPRDYGGDDEAPTTLSRKRAVVVIIVITCLLFIQCMSRKKYAMSGMIN